MAHEDDADLASLVVDVQMVKNPRMAIVMTEEGTVHFAASIAPCDAAAVLENLAEHIRRYHVQYTRASSAHLN